MIKTKTSLLLSLPLLLLALLVPFISVHAHEEKEHTIKMVPEGFTPKSLEIAQGDTVVFTNEDNTPRWPASNIHPTHQIYSDFDPKTAVPPGESWSFRFTKSGTWKFHDHLKPQFVGDINVLEDEHQTFEVEEKNDEFGVFMRLKIWAARLYFKIFPGEAKQVMQKLDVFAVTDEDNPATERELRYKLEVFGPKPIMDDLLADSGNGSIRDCHQPAHTVGRVGFETYGAKVFKDGDASCHSGFYHGAMEGFIQQKGVNNLADDMSELCSTFETEFGNFQCLHGVGHGVVAYESYDLPAALGLCKQLYTQLARSSCYGGAFMENIMVAQGLGAIPGHETEWISDDPLFPCNALEKDHTIQFQCWQMQTSWMRTLYHEDASKIIEQCQRAPADYIEVCFRSWGRDLASIYLRDVNEIARGCAAVPDTEKYYDACISGGLNVVIDFWGNRLQDQAARLCYLVPSEHKDSCYYGLAYRLQDIFNNDRQREQACRYFEADYQHRCQA